VWEALHVVTSLAAPWALAAWFLRVNFASIDGEWHFVLVFHSVAAVAAGVLVCSSAMLRAGGAAVAASMPFTLFWAVALAAALYEVHEFGGGVRCGVEMCMPAFGVFLTAVPFALVVTCGVAVSAAFHQVRPGSASHTLAGRLASRYGG
jgi:hypothetical protein